MAHAQRHPRQQIKDAHTGRIAETLVKLHQLHSELGTHVIISFKGHIPLRSFVTIEWLKACSSVTVGPLHACHRIFLDEY